LRIHRTRETEEVAARTDAALREQLFSTQRRGGARRSASRVRSTARRTPLDYSADADPYTSQDEDDELQLPDDEWLHQASRSRIPGEYRRQRHANWRAMACKAKVAMVGAAQGRAELKQQQCEHRIALIQLQLDSLPQRHACHVYGGLPEPHVVDHRSVLLQLLFATVGEGC
jgi:hypothetical protein